MKKKIFLTISTLFVTCAVMIGIATPVEVKAATPSTVTAKAPTTVPEKDAELYAILDKPFDYGTYIKFGDTQARTDMKKIILTTKYNNTLSTLKDDTDNWFTVYCLDGNLKYPELSFGNYGDFDNADYAVQSLLAMALFNSPKSNIDEVQKLYTIFEKAKGYQMAPVFEYTIPDGYSTTQEILDAVEEDKTVTINVSKITYTKSINDNQTVVITAEELSGEEGTTVYPITIKKSEIMLDRYTATIMSGENYAHALWILEHSYPTFDLKLSLEMAGADIDEAIAEVMLLQNIANGKTEDQIVNELKTIKACTAKDELATLFGINAEEVTQDKCEEKYKEILATSKVEDFVYFTTQYAVWKANKVTVSGKEISDSLTSKQEGFDSYTNQLNKLYQYLIKDRAEYNGYLNFQFDNTLKLNKPESGKEIFKDTNTHFVYGPYTVEYDMLSVKDVTVSLDGTPEGASIVDEAGNAITTLLPNQKFYIKADKTKKVTNLKVKLKTENAITFKPTTNRGRIYYSYYPLTQNVVSGGKYVTMDVEKTIEIVFNPKTGDSNTALLFVITLIGFSLGYVALIMKNKPIELN